MDLSLFLTHLAACGAAAATGAMFQPGDWYMGLKKPGWTPPRWLFPTAWTTLYLLMSLAAARIGALQGPGVGQALGLWSVQIALNTLWTPIFFGLHRMRSALIVMAFLWLAVAATMVSFFRLDFWAGVMFLPYLAWVSTAFTLNLSVLRLNPAPRG